MRLSLIPLLFVIGAFALTAFAQGVPNPQYVTDYTARNYSGSLTAARAAIKAEPPNWVPHYYAGLSLISLDKEKDAVKVLQKAESLNKTNAAVKAALAYAYLLRNDKKATDKGKRGP